METKYDAFISYKHEKTDIFVAEQLQTLLEHYKVPKKIREITGKNKIDRIFRDTQELSVAPDLTEKIQKALLNSEFLILICSPESLKSEWVKRELDFFLETHEKERVLTVLVKGEPEEAIPEVLRYKTDTMVEKDGSVRTVKTLVEPLSANVRGESEKEIKKRLKIEYLRLLAPMLSCAYDQLKMRHREYTLRRNFTIAGVIAVVAFVFSLYTLWQSLQIQEQYEQARRNQARYLSSISQELFDAGDRTAALQTALAIAPDKEEDGPVVPEQMFALNNALYSYKSPAVLDYKPYANGEADSYSKGCLSPEGGCFLVIDKNGTAVFLSPETGKAFWTVSAEEFSEEDGEHKEFHYGIPVSDSKAVLVCSDAFFYVDSKEQRLIKKVLFDTEYAVSLSQNNSAVWGEKLAFVEENSLFLYDYAAGEIISRTSFEKLEGSDAEDGISDLCFSPDGSSIAIGFSGEEERDALLLYLVETNAFTEISRVATEQVCFTDDTHIGAVQYEYTGSDYDTGLGSYQNNRYYVAVYDVEKKEQVLCSEKESFLEWGHTKGICVADMAVDGKKKQHLFSYLNNRLFIVDTDTNELVETVVYDGIIKGMAKYDAERMYIGLEDGSVQVFYLNQPLQKNRMSIVNTPVTEFYYSSKYDTMIQIADETIIINAFVEDEQLKQLDIEDWTKKGYGVREVTYHKAGDDGYRMILFRTEESYDLAAIAVYPVGEEQACFSYEISETGGKICDMAIGLKTNIPVLCYMVKEAVPEKISFMMADLHTGEILVKQDLGSYTTLTLDYDVHFSKDMSYFVAGRTKGAVIFDITEEGVEPRSVALKRNQSIDDIELTGDGRYIVFTTHNRDYSSEIIEIYDAKEKKYVLNDRELCYSGEIEMKSGLSGSLVAVCINNRYIDILDCASGEVRCRIDTEYYQRFDYAFFGDDQYLITSIDLTVTMWDLKTGTPTMRYEMPEDNMSGFKIYTDQSNSWFAIKDTAYSIHYETGKNTSVMQLFFVDKDFMFYPYAEVDYGYCSFSGQEVGVLSYTRFYYGDFYEYAQLKQQAESFLDGNVMTEAEKKQYFISE